MRLKPTGNKVLVSLLLAGNEQVGTIAIPEQFRDSTSAEGVVVSIGGTVENVKVGDRVIIPRHDGTNIAVDGKPHKLFQAEELLAVLDHA